MRSDLSILYEDDAIVVLDKPATFDLKASGSLGLKGSLVTIN